MKPNPQIVWANIDHPKVCAVIAGDKKTLIDRIEEIMKGSVIKMEDSA